MKITRTRIGILAAALLASIITVAVIAAGGGNDESSAPAAQATEDTSEPDRDLDTPDLERVKDSITTRDGGPLESDGGRARVLGSDAGSPAGGPAGPTPGPTPGQPGLPGQPDPTVPTHRASVSSILVEDCITLVDDDVFVSEVVVSDCNAAHGMEVFAHYEIPDETYPGSRSLLRSSYSDCQLFFEDYVGLGFWDSVFDIRTLTPSVSSWDQGDRAVTCLIVDIEREPLSFPAKDSRH